MELVVVQLTDIHITGEDDLDILLSRTGSIVGAIGEVVRKPAETLLLLCVTGDIANTGTKEQYDVAGLFFEDISDKIKDRYSDELWFHFVFVPGNHDCDFSSELVTARNAIIANKDADINDAGVMQVCLSPQKNFFAFVEEMAKKDLCMPLNKNGIFTENVLENTVNPNLSDWKIKLHCLNTAWCSQLQEKKDMRFDIPKNLVKEENDIVITLMHHGSNWFDWEGNDVWDEYHRDYSDIVLVGHDHKFNYLLETNFDSSTNYFIKGNQLYSKDEKDQSGFNIVKINLDDSIEIFYSYVWKNGLYEKYINSEPTHFERNRYKDSSISIKPEMREFLEEIEVDIVNKYKSPLLLSDVFVFPVLQGKMEDKPERTKTYRGQEKIIEILNQKKKVLIDGAKEFGKTGLLKRLFMIYSEEGLFPVMLKGEEIKSADECEINKLIRGLYADSYNNINIDAIMQMLPENKVCLIDDFDTNYLSDKSQKAFLEDICSQFGKVIITCNSKNNMVAPVKNIETNGYFESDFYRLEIVTMRRVVKNALIKKWLLLEDPMQDVSSLEFEAKVRAKSNQIYSVLKNGYFSNTPIEFLLVLSYIDNAQAISTDYSKYSYIYDSLIREKINQIADQDTQMCSAYMRLLQLLAYDLYITGQGETFDEDTLLRAIYKYNEEYPPFKSKATTLIKRLLDYQILSERKDRYKFRFSYMFYYFAGSYIDQVMSRDEQDAKIKEILSDLSKETDFNIALFIAYSISTEHTILPIVKEVEESLLKEFKGVKYEDLCKAIGDVSDAILERVNIYYEYDIPLNSEIPELQRKLMEHRDDMDEIDSSTKKEISETEKRAKENFDIIFNDFTKLLRLIQFEGEVLKNYAPKIKNQPRAEMIELMGESTMKLLGFFGNMLSTELDKFIEVVEKKAQPEDSDKKIDKTKLVLLIKDYMSVIWSQFVEINVTNLALCWDTDMISQDIYNIKEKNKSAFFDMVNVEYRLRIADTKLPIREVDKCLSGKEKLDAFSSRILKRIVGGYLMNYQYDPVEKERMCDMLGFNYHALYIEEKKQEAIGMNE